MCVLLALVLLQSPSPSVQPKQPIVKNSAGSNTATAPTKHGQSKLPPAESKNAGVPSAPSPTTDQGQKKDGTPERIYKVDVVSPPAKPLDTPLFPVYLVITGIGVFVNTWIACLIFRQNKINKIVADAARKSAKAAQDTADILVKSEKAIIVVELRPDTKPASSSYSLKATNIGRAPAEIMSFRIGYSLLSGDVMELRMDEIGSNPILRNSGLVIGGGKTRTLESRIDVAAYIRGGWMEISQLKKNGIFHGSVRYLTSFGEEEAEAHFCYYVKSTTGSLVKVNIHSMGRKWEIPVPHRPR